MLEVLRYEESHFTSTARAQLRTERVKLQMLPAATTGHRSECVMKRMQTRVDRSGHWQSMAESLQPPPPTPYAPASTAHPIHITHHPVASWQKHTNLSYKSPNFGEFKANINILSTHNLLCWKGGCSTV